jgi:outer membrane lipoprotein SlyB
MKRVACGVLIAAAISGSVMPASAGDGFSTGMAAAVGAVGGFALGSALARPVYGPPPVYVERVYEARCFVERERVWVPGWGWEFRRRTICD